MGQAVPGSAALCGHSPDFAHHWGGSSCGSLRFQQPGLCQTHIQGSIPHFLAILMNWLVLPFNCLMQCKACFSTILIIST